MFTGIISAVGTVSEVRPLPGQQKEVVIQTPYLDLKEGESIAVCGVCLTVASFEPNPKGTAATFFISPETLSRSNLGALSPQTLVNLERALTIQDRLSGHLVQGHVDGLGKLKAVRPKGACFEIEIQCETVLLRYMVEKGSVALDGISLTINSIEKSNIYLMIVPHTWTHTNLSAKQAGQDFNVELDVIAKYIEKLAGPYKAV